jgi:hypothetical protein
MSHGDNARWLAEILARVKRRLTSHRDLLTHSQAAEIRGVLADVDAASLIAKEIKNEHTDGPSIVGTDLPGQPNGTKD